MAPYFASPRRTHSSRRVILRATEMGMCFGVRDALHVLDGIAEPTTVTVHGELVHNADVLRQLAARGFQQTDEGTRPIPTTPRVLITAHGISERERHRLQSAGKELIDTTCPLVHKAHAAAQALQREGRRVIVLGRHGHVEVRGIVEDLCDPIVVEKATDVVRWPETRLGVVCQTTTQDEVAAALLAAITAANPHADVAFRDTICSPTRARVQALEALFLHIDGLVVVGGRASNNTAQLAARARARGIPVLLVEGPRDLDATWLRQKHTLGLTAGTSTPAATIDAVHAALQAMI